MSLSDLCNRDNILQKYRTALWQASAESRVSRLILNIFLEPLLKSKEEYDNLFPSSIPRQKSLLTQDDSLQTSFRYDSPQS